MTSKDYESLKQKYDKVHFLFEEQWKQNYFIKNKNIELEDKIKQLEKKIEVLTK